MRGEGEAEEERKRKDNKQLMIIKKRKTDKKL